MSDHITYKNITATVRTPRCAIFINENSENWQTAASGAIACASEVWGGRYFLIIPTDGNRIRDKFWEILEAYSPDHLAVYSLTFADLEFANPNLYATVKSRHKEQYEAQGFSLDFDDWFTQSANTSRIDQFKISDEMAQELVERLSPFHHRSEIVWQHLSRRSGFGFPFTKIVDILPYVTGNIENVTLPKAIDDHTLALMLHSQTGNSSQQHRADLSSKRIAINELADDQANIELLQFAFGRRWSAQSSRNYMPQTPFSLSMLHLGQYYRAGIHHAYKEPLVVVLGDAAEDYCLYYSLSRLHENVCWLPLTWLRDCSKAVRDNRRRHERGEERQPFDSMPAITSDLMGLFFELIEYGHHEKRIELRSMSLTHRQLIAYKRQMADCSPFPDFRSKVDCVPLEQKVTECILRVFEENNYVNHESVAFMAGESVSPFATPKPKNFRRVVPPNHNWVTSLQIEGYGPPALATLGTEILNMHGLGTESRVAADGIAYHCPNIAYFGGDIDVNLVRPKIRLPDEMALLGAYFGYIGVTIRYSDKGNYLADTVQRFGGLDEVGRFIKAPSTRSVLDKFMSKVSFPDGSVIYITNDQRAYLNLQAITNSVGDETRAADLVDLLVGKRILQRGYLLQCEKCRLASWYSLDVLTSHFTCNRCSYTQQFNRGRWKKPVEPRWYYKLAETVYQYYSNNSHLTTQLLFYLKSQARMAFHYVPEIDLVDFPVAGKKRELDIACILDGQIVIGECKTEDLRSRDIGKFTELCRRLRRRPDRIVFATTKESVAEEFLGSAGRLRNAEILKFRDLYSR